MGALGALAGLVGEGLRVYGPVPADLARLKDRQVFSAYEALRVQQGQPTRGGPGRAGRRLPLAAFGSFVPRAVVLVEDPAFRRHPGFSLGAMLYAARLNLRRGELLYGASTITQQTARNLWLSPERSLRRKAHELVLAVLLEAALSKDEILSVYLNLVELGPGLYGFEAAAQQFFGLAPRRLSREQALALVSVMPRPLRADPRTWTNDPVASLRYRWLEARVAAPAGPATSQ